MTTLSLSSKEADAAAKANGNTSVPAWPVMLLLVGPPGAGKSTFCSALCAAVPGKWQSVNQDVIGSRQGCLKGARTAIEGGRSIIVDRCNVTVDQRKDFLALASQLRVPVHVLVIRPPMAVAIKRAAGRDDHPGKVMGKAAPRVVAMVYRQMEGAGDPLISEGFESIMVCCCDEAVQAAKEAWAHYPNGPQECGSSERGGEPSSVGSLRKEGSFDSCPRYDPFTWWKARTAHLPAPPALTPRAPKGTKAQGQTTPSKKARTEPAKSGQGHQTSLLNFFPVGSGKKQPEENTKGQSAAVSTGESVEAEAAKLQISNHTPQRVIPSSFSSMPSNRKQVTEASKSAATQRPEIPHTSTAVKSEQGASLPSNSGAVGGTRSGITPPSTYGKGTHSRDDALQGANPPSASAVAPHNEGDTPKGIKPPSTFGGETHDKISQPASGRGTDGLAQRGSTGEAQRMGSAVGCVPQASDAGAAEEQGMGSAARRSAIPSGARPATQDSREPASTSGRSKSGVGGTSNVASGPPAFNFQGAWAQALYDTALHPERHKDTVLLFDEKVVLMRDGYPKAARHALLLARDPALSSIADLRRQHLGLLEHMRGVAQNWAAEQTAQEPHLRPFAFGFHSIPSMRQMHLHIITTDFDSPCIKNKKHWNSFTTPFFRPLEEAIEEVRTLGQMVIDIPKAESYLRQNLRCHLCKLPLANIPALKTHLRPCLAKMCR